VIAGEAAKQDAFEFDCVEAGEALVGWHQGKVRVLQGGRGAIAGAKVQITWGKAQQRTQGESGMSCHLPLTEAGLASTIPQPQEHTVPLQCLHAAIKHCVAQAYSKTWWHRSNAFHSCKWVCRPPRYADHTGVYTTSNLPGAFQRWAAGGQRLQSTGQQRADAQIARASHLTAFTLLRPKQTAISHQHTCIDQACAASVPACHQDNPGDPA
jgi:hypothetical protein